MNNELKHILLKLARLPWRDQRWILRKLSKVQKKTFLHHEGKQLLIQARRFRTMKFSIHTTPLPDYSQDLAHHHPLYIAIILEHGNFPWKQQFLTNFDKEKQIDNHFETLEKISLASQKIVFNLWKSKRSFEEHLPSDLTQSFIKQEFKHG